MTSSWGGRGIFMRKRASSPQTWPVVVRVRRGTCWYLVAPFKLRGLPNMIPSFEKIKDNILLKLRKKKKQVHSLLCKWHQLSHEWCFVPLPDEIGLVSSVNNSFSDWPICVQIIGILTQPIPSPPLSVLKSHHLHCVSNCMFSTSLP